MSKKILFAASECAPFVKTGGLADVAAALPVQLKEIGADIRVVLPLYAKIKAQFGMHMRHECDFNIKLGWRNQYCGVESLVQRGITYYFPARALFGYYTDINHTCWLLRQRICRG